MLIHFAHANGFPAESYAYFFQQFRNHRIIAIPSIGATVEMPIKSWHDLKKELIAFLEKEAQEPVVGIGHSLGGVITYWAARERPDLFHQIILLDPPLFRPLKRKAAGLIDAVGLAHKFIPPAIKSKRRKRRFASFEEAEKVLRDKHLFREFHPQSFKDYIQYGWVQDDQGVRLKIPAERETHFFCKTPHTLGRFQLKIPMDYIYSTRYEVTEEKDIAYLQRYFKGVPFHSIDAGHMFPLEQPEKTAALLESIIKKNAQSID
jgi:pimeloyl-ACP methyl ester carboxylesterase